MPCLVFRREQFLQWVEKLADNQTPSWLGLPNNAEMVLLTNKGVCTTFILSTIIHHTHIPEL